MIDPDQLPRYPPHFGLLGARLNAATLIETLDELALTSRGQRRQVLSELHGLAIDVWDAVGVAIDAHLTAEANR